MGGGGVNGRDGEWLLEGEVEGRLVRVTIPRSRSLQVLQLLFPKPTTQNSRHLTGRALASFYAALTPQAIIIDCPILSVAGGLHPELFLCKVSMVHYCPYGYYVAETQLFEPDLLAVRLVEMLQTYYG